MAKNQIYSVEINPKVSNYHTNGTGRDLYIKYNNGGFKNLVTSEDNRTKIISKLSRGDFTKSVNINPKINKYHNNGTGRDSFISKTCGGFYKGGNITVHTYNYTLRNYQAKPIILRNDFLKISQNFVRKEIIPILKETNKQQRATSARLSKPKYHTPKHLD